MAGGQGLWPSKLVGKPISDNDLPQESYRDIFNDFGLPEGIAIVLDDSDAKAKDGALCDDRRTLPRLIERLSTPISRPIAAALHC